MTDSERVKRSAYMREYSRKRAAKDPEYLAARRQSCRDFRKRNPNYQSRWSKNNPHKKLMIQAKARAKRKGIEFDIAESEIVWHEFCPYLGFKLEYRTNKVKALQDSASLDRIDSSLGYVKGNVEAISYRANIIKNCGTAEEHALIAMRLLSLRSKNQ